MKERTPTFTVVVPILGLETNIEAALASVQAQTWTNLELIVVVNDSDIEARLTTELTTFGEGTVRIVRTAELRRAGAMNAGAQVATGRFLAFLMPDDAFHPDRLAVFARAIAKTTSLEWGFSGLEAIDGLGRPIGVDDIRDPVLRQTIWRSARPLEVVHALGREDALASPGNLVVAHKRFESIGAFRELHSTEGWDLALRLLDLGRPYAAERPLYRLRVATDGARLPKKGGVDERKARDTEAASILAEHAARASATYAFAPPPDPFDELRPDEVAAVRAALRGVRTLRRLPPAYSAIRSGSRLFQKLGRRPR